MLEVKGRQRILLLKMDHIGDALWAFPAIRALQAALPDAALDMLCTPYLAETFRRVAELKQVVEYDAAAGLAERWSILGDLRQRSYNAAIVLGPVDKVNHLAFAAGAAQRYGYAYAGNLVHAVTSRLFLTRRLPHPADLASRDGKPLPHEVPALLALVAESGADPLADPALFFPLSASEKADAASLLHRLLPARTAFAALHLCAKSFRHGWDEAAFAELAARLQSAAPGVGWIVTAGPAEAPGLSAYEPRLTALGIPIVSGLPLGQTAALLAQTKLLVSWDTGVVHLACAVGTPVVDIFPDKDFDYCVQRWGPRGPSGHSVRQAGAVPDAATLEQVLKWVRAILTERQEVPTT